VELENALNLVNTIVLTKTGRSLREPELALFQGTWLGLTYEQMAESSGYSNNYLMRDVGPKLWRLLSDALGRPVGKTNLRDALESIDQSALSQSISAHVSRDTSARRSSIAMPPSSQRPSRSAFNVILNRDITDLPKSVASYGYTQELENLTQWVLEENCRLVGIWGLNGVGKTTLARRLVDQIHDQFEIVGWQTLHPAPTLHALTETLPEILAGFLPNPPLEPGSSLGARSSIGSWLLVLNGIESVLQPGQTAGHYREGYENYRDFFQRICEDPHQGCVIVTGLEPPREFTRLEGQTSVVRSLMLSGLSPDDSALILEEERLIRSDQWETLIDYYRGHPAALRIMGRIIRELFSGSVVEFLKQQSFTFEDINKLLEQSFDRLSGLEKEILYCLASESQPTTLATLQQLSRPLSLYPVELLEALDSLKQRSLLEIIHSDDQAQFSLQPVVRDYVVNQFIAQVRGLSVTQEWHDRWSLQSTVPSLALTPSEPKTTTLNEWLQNRFDPDWEPVEILFAHAPSSAQRLRSVFHLRGERTIKRLKQIQLGTNPQGSHLVLLVAINPESDQSLNICVQVQPNHEETVLPANLTLTLLDASENSLAEIQSQEQDDFIQLPYFRGIAQECFNIQLSLDTATHREKFIV
jgi:GTPase SAR1 family protein